MSTIEQDPLAGDVDKWVDPKETRTDAEIERDEQLAARAHMSGADGADEYWADYDEYHGTVNGGEEPAEPAIHEGVMHGPHMATDNPYEVFDKQNSAVIEAAKYGEISDEDAGKLQSDISDKREARTDAIEFRDYHSRDFRSMTEPVQQKLKKLDAEDDAYWAEQDRLLDQESDDGGSYINGHRLDDVQEDPLAGDVEPTGGYPE